MSDEEEIEKITRLWSRGLLLIRGWRGVYALRGEKGNLMKGMGGYGEVYDLG